jgi:hypothetical protein
LFNNSTACVDIVQSVIERPSIIGRTITGARHHVNVLYETRLGYIVYEDDFQATAAAMFRGVECQEHTFLLTDEQWRERDE